MTFAPWGVNIPKNKNAERQNKKEKPYEKESTRNRIVLGSRDRIGLRFGCLQQ